MQVEYERASLPDSRMFEINDLMLDAVLKTVDSNRNVAVSALKQLLAIPSVSASPEHKNDVERAASWLAEQLRLIQFQARVIPTPGHPVVLASNHHRSDRSTVLLYGHYDVQPPDPLDQWLSPPFEPAVRDGAIYARGACDDKGQLWCHMEAIRAWQAHGGLPVNLIILFEGEEEVGSEHLEEFIRHHGDLLRADIAVISDTGQFARGVPAITYALRGLCYAEVLVSGPSHDLHSGLFGGAVPNPANVLCRLVASLHDENGRVNIPGFYDDVEELTPRERQMWQKLPFSEEDFFASLGLPHGSGEAGYTTIERKWARPTCDVNGITSGYQGPGAKTVLPAAASAKISMRLVPRQDPAKIQQAFEQAIRQRCPSNVKVKIVWHSASEAAVVPIDSKATQLAAEAMEIGFGKKPAFIRDGGSIPVVSLLRRTLGIDTLLVGFGLPDDRVHSPNEKFELECLYAGMRTAAALYDRLARL